MLKLYNTLTRKTEDFVPLNRDLVTFYHCGPTVYWSQHIGNLRGMTMGDLLVRTLNFLGYHTRHVRNYTDVGHLTSDADTGEDKMEKGAKREHLTPEEIARKYIDMFEEDVRRLNLREPDIKPRPSAMIGDIQEMINVLIAKKYAYNTDLAVYYDVSRFPDYTKLSGHDLEKNIAGSGKADVEDRSKKHPADFALWVFKAGSHANALQTWPSPYRSKLVEGGVGFPGWHIECSVMAKKYLGLTIDIHMGGVEHIPIHHTNEIAQSQAANGVKFVNYWLHNEHLVVNNEKMAKSQGTGMTLAEVTARGFDPLALRYFYLQAHYRTRQNFSWEALQAAQTAYREIKSRVASIRAQDRSQTRVQLSEEKMAKISEFRNRFTYAVSADLNIPQALAILWETIKSNIPAPDKYDLALDFDQVLGLKLDEVETDFSGQLHHGDLPEKVKQMLAEREKYRRNQDFKQADQIRKDLLKLGYILEDTAEGVTIRRNTSG